MEVVRVYVNLPGCKISSHRPAILSVARPFATDTKPCRQALRMWPVIHSAWRTTIFMGYTKFYINQYLFWLVVYLPPLKNMKVNGKDYPIYYEKWKIMQTTNQYFIEVSTHSGTPEGLVYFMDPKISWVLGNLRYPHFRKPPYLIISYKNHINSYQII